MNQTSRRNAVWCFGLSCLQTGPTPVVLAGVLAALFAASPAKAADPSDASDALRARTTIAVFSDNARSTEQWDLLFAALSAEMAKGGAELKAVDRTAEFVRGETEADAPVTVELHGNCNLEPQERRTNVGHPLGWVRRVNGQIEPVIHVDCAQLGRVLGAQVRWLSRPARDRVMARALSRVILHEWIHYATQNPAHAETGIAKAGFDIPDLIRDAPPAERASERTGGGR